MRVKPGRRNGIGIVAFRVGRRGGDFVGGGVGQRDRGARQGRLARVEYLASDRGAEFLGGGAAWPWPAAARHPTGTQYDFFFIISVLPARAQLRDVHNVARGLQPDSAPCVVVVILPTYAGDKGCISDRRLTLIGNCQYWRLSRFAWRNQAGVELRALGRTPSAIRRLAKPLKRQTQLIVGRRVRSRRPRSRGGTARARRSDRRRSSCWMPTDVQTTASCSSCARRRNRSASSSCGRAPGLGRQTAAAPDRACSARPAGRAAGAIARRRDAAAPVQSRLGLQHRAERVVRIGVARHRASTAARSAAAARSRSP